MIVNNGKRLIVGKAFVDGGVSATGLIDAYKLVDKEGRPGEDNKNVQFSNVLFNRCNQVGSVKGVGMVLGLGTTEPTVNDYWLADTDVDGTDINSIITISSESNNAPGVGSTSTTPEAMIYTTTFRNTDAENSYTINEIGLYIVVNVDYPAQPFYRTPILIARKNIPARTVAPLESITFSYAFEVML